MKKYHNFILKLDWMTICLYLILTFIGWISVYAAMYNDDYNYIFDFSQRYGKQLVWIITAMLIAIIILIADSKFYSVFANLMYWFVIAMLVLVLLAGSEINGSRSWFIFGPVRLQPAELAKVATAIILAKIMSTHGFVLKRNMYKILMAVGLPVILVFLQHDTGSALVFASFLLMLYHEGLSGWFLGIIIFAIIVFILAVVWETVSVMILCAVMSMLAYIYFRKKIRYPLLFSIIAFTLYYIITEYLLSVFHIVVEPDIIFSLVCFIVIVIGAINAIKQKLRYVWYIILFFIGSIGLTYSVDYTFDHVLKSHQRDRIENLLGITEDLQGSGYNVHQSKVAIGSGGIFGKGFLQGTQTNYNFVPEQSTDFIFCTIGEEWGFAGSLAVIVCYVLLLIRLVIISERQKDNFSRIYGYCVISILFFHFAINISMTIGLAPVVGIPLPFISYGGSSLWAFTILLFIMLKLDAVRWR